MAYLLVLEKEPEVVSCPEELLFYLRGRKEREGGWRMING